MNDSTIIQTLN